MVLKRKSSEPSACSPGFIHDTSHHALASCPSFINSATFACFSKSTTPPRQMNSMSFLSSSPATTTSEFSSTDISKTPNEDDAIGLSDTKLSKKRRDMLDLTNQLHSTGVQADIDLPQIAVIGSQSAGKSSLIESISGIKLPRASGTCTRCPTECRLSHSSSPWKCTVSLRYTVDSNGESLKQIRNDAFGPPITDRGDVEERLRRAQRAILNPSTDVKVFLNGEDKDPDELELTFSSNCVSVQISGKDVADLSFCDLPGLIASVGKGGNKGDVALVENLLVSYINKPSCLILLTVACETDFETQKANTLAQEHDPDGKRTIGVLTKPDRIAAGDEKNWIPYLENSKEPLDLGWYCVKQPDTLQLNRGITWSEARANEEEYFKEKEPWCSLPFHSQQHLGTVNLVERLSDTLSELISRRLPELQDELDVLIGKTQEGLKRLPLPPSTDPLTEILHLISAFSRDISSSVEGTPDDNGLIQSLKPKQQAFKTSIRATAPQFIPHPWSVVSSEDAPVMPTMEFLSNEDGNVSPEASGDVLDLDDIMERAEKARTRELPDNYPFVVTQKLIESFIHKWERPALNLFESVHAILLQHVKKKVQDHFVRFGQGGLLQTVQVIVMDHLKKCHERTKSHLEWLLRLETRPFTMNTHYLADYKDKFLVYYKGCRQKHDNRTLTENINLYTPPPASNRYNSLTNVQEGMSKVLSGLGQLGLSGVKPDDLHRLLPPDYYETALGIMASCRAYFQVAYKRFTDYVPLALDRDLVLALGDGIETVLINGIISGDNTTQRCRDLLQESPAVASRREELQKKLGRLQKARQELMDLW